MLGRAGEVFDRVKKGTPNYSLRMSDLTACCVRPQARAAPHARTCEPQSKTAVMCSPRLAARLFPAGRSPFVALVPPPPIRQIDTLEDRIAVYNARYERIVSQLQGNDAGAAHFHIPPIDARVRPVCDSLQINLRGLTGEQVDAFLEHSKRRGMPVGLFGSADNARNFRNWQYSPIATDVDATEAMIAAAIDVRLPLSFEDEDFDDMGAVLLAALDDTLA